MSEEQIAKKNQPAIRFKGFSGDWVERKLLDNFEKIIDFRGRTPKKLGLNWSNSGYLALSALNVKNGYIDLNVEANYGDQELYDAWMTGNELHKNQVLFTTEAPMGNVAQVPDNNKYILSQRTIAFQVKPQLLEESFLAVILRSNNVFTKLSSLSSGGTAKGVSQKSLSGVDIRVPKDTMEQTQIGEYFQQLDRLIAQHQQKHDKLKQIKKALLEKMFPQQGASQPQIRFKGFSGDWEEKALGEATTIQAGGTPNTANIDYWEPKEIPWMSSGEINKKRLDSTDNMISQLGLSNSSARWIPNNSVLIALAGQGKTRGMVAINNIALTTNQSIAAITPNSQLNHEFLYQNLTKRYEELRARSSGDGTRGGLNKQIISEVEIQTPEVEEQTQIGNFFQQLDKFINQQQSQLTKLNNIKQSLISKMFV